MFQSPRSFISYHVLTDEGREAIECRHAECCCIVGGCADESLSRLKCKVSQNDLDDMG